jgi:IclR family acetate operon transcriptional repressor
MDAPLGVSRPYNCTAVGKVILAHLPTSEFERLAAAESFVQFTPNSITDPTQLAAELERIRQQGYALDHEEFRIGGCCVAAPIYDHNGQVVAAITVTGPTERLHASLDPIIEQVLTNSQEISTRLGHNLEVNKKVA